LLHSIVISLVSKCHHHPSMMHLSTHQDISLGQKIVHVHHRKTSDGAGCLYFFEQKRTPIVLLQLKVIQITNNLHSLRQPMACTE